MEERLGGYELRAVRGSGSAATVYEAFDPKDTPKDYHFNWIVSERWYNSILDGMRHPRY